ncbi:MAG: esterase family protein [Treponema sp.]|jgi:S-formylglutathione hydrolase FrmB|nr:esterase family protein [Treponema sp.]
MAIIKVRFRSEALKRSVSFSVCLPLEDPPIPNIPRHNKAGKFKTMYLLHGFSGDEMDWIYYSDIDALSFKYNMAFVMPSIENSFYLDDVKREAYYAKYLGEELVAFTRRAFPLSYKWEDTLIGGLSMGGYGAMRNGLYYHDVFGAIIALSSAYITDDVAAMPPGQGNPVASYDYYEHTFGPPSELKGSDKDPKALASRLAEAKAVIPAIYMACGSEDFLIEQNRDNHRHLEKIGVPHRYDEGPGIHDFKFWNEYIDKALQWYTELV